MSLKKQFLKSKQACKVTFSLPKKAANGAKEVKLLGDFNNWEKDKGIPMEFKDGHFTASLNLESGKEYQFRYLLDNELWQNDSKTDKYGFFGTHPLQVNLFVMGGNRYSMNN